MSCISNPCSAKVCQKEEGHLLSPCAKATIVVLSALLTLAGVFSLLNSFGIFNFGLGTIGSTGSYVMIGIGVAGILIALDYTKKIITGQKLRSEYRFIAVTYVTANGTINEARTLRDRLSVIDQYPIASFASGFVRLIASLVHMLTYLTLAALKKEKEDEHLEEVALGGRNFTQATLAMIPFVGNFILWIKNKYNKSKEIERLPKSNISGFATLYEFGKEKKSIRALPYLELIIKNPSPEEVLALFELSPEESNRFGGFTMDVEGRYIYNEEVSEETFNGTIAQLDT